jgi:large subunit ribosomal protein L22
MNALAKARNLRVSPLKMRKIIKLISGKKVDDALFILKNLPNKSAKMAYKVLFSGKANYKNKHPEVASPELKIMTIFADQAPVLRRMMPRARGRADVLRKQSCHLTVVLNDGSN